MLICIQTWEHYSVLSLAVAGFPYVSRAAAKCAPRSVPRREHTLSSKMNPVGFQFPDGFFSAWSITKISTRSFLDSRFSPSCSRSADATSTMSGCSPGFAPAM
jgi:hypothetical protein